MKIMHTIKCKRYFILIFFAISLLSGDVAYGFQQDTLNSTLKEEQLIAEPEKEIVISSDIREELHRYIGYERLLPRYLSLPYDVVMNTNIGGPLIDFGFLLLVFLPILLLFGIKNRWLKIGVALLMVLFLIISIPTGYQSYRVISPNQIDEGIRIELAQNSFTSHPLTYLKLQWTRCFNSIYQPIHQNIIEVYSGDGDAITYPIFFFIFLMTFMILKSRLKEVSLGKKVISYFLLMYNQIEEINPLMLTTTSR